jgi:serine/threonine protein kinase
MPIPAGTRFGSYQEFAGDVDRLARFQREAEVLASLNHPNIAQIYGLEKADGKTVIVMELVDGSTLADRIAAGSIPPATKAASRAAPRSTSCSTGSRSSGRGCLCHRKRRMSFWAYRVESRPKSQEQGCLSRFGLGG